MVLLKLYIIVLLYNIQLINANLDYIHLYVYYYIRIIIMIVDYLNVTNNHEMNILYLFVMIILINYLNIF